MPAYLRADGQHKILVAANDGIEPQTLALGSVSKVLLPNMGKENAVLSRAHTEGRVTPIPCECAVILL